MLRRPAAMLLVGALVATSLSSATPAWAAKGAQVRKPPRGDICAETPPFVAMEMLAVPIIRDGYVSGILNVKPCFATSAEQADAVSARLPVLQDYYVQRLHLYASRRINPDRPLDLPAIHALLQEGADKLLGQSVPVLVTFAAMRRIG